MPLAQVAATSPLPNLASDPSFMPYMSSDGSAAVSSGTGPENLKQSVKERVACIPRHPDDRR
jgi:hypothetical protein